MDVKWERDLGFGRYKYIQKNWEGLDWLLRVYEVTLHRFMTHLDVKHDIDIHKDTKDIMTDPDKLGPEMIQMFYYSMYLMAIVKTLIGMDLK
jgi:hypothetical protein